MRENNSKKDTVDLNLEGEIKGNASTNNLKNNGVQNKNEVSIQSANGNVSTKGKVNNRVSKPMTNAMPEPGAE